MARTKFAGVRPLVKGPTGSTKVKAGKAQPFTIRSAKESKLVAKRQRVKQDGGETRRAYKRKAMLLNRRPVKKEGPRAIEMGVKAYMNELPGDMAEAIDDHDSLVRGARHIAEDPSYYEPWPHETALDVQREYERDAKEYRTEVLPRLAHARDEYPKFKRNMRAMGSWM